MANIESSRQNALSRVAAATGKPIFPAAFGPEMEEVIAKPERTSPLGLEQYIAGRTLVSGDSPAWNDMFVQVYSRLNKQEPFLVPAVAEPLIVWVISGEAVVEERDLDGDFGIGGRGSSFRAVDDISLILANRAGMLSSRPCYLDQNAA